MDTLAARQASRAARQTAAGTEQPYERPDARMGGSAYYEVSASLNFGAIAAQTSADLTIAAPTGVTFREDAPVVVSPPQALNAGLIAHGFVTDGGASVTVRVTNATAGSLDPAAGTFTALVAK